MLIQIEGTPTAAAAPASTPRTRRRVMGTGDHEEREKTDDMGRYMAFAGSTWNLRRDCRPPRQSLSRKSTFPISYRGAGGVSIQFLLDFRPLRAFKAPTFSERLSFRPAARPMRPEANARQRDAPSGAKVFGRSFWRVLPRHIGSSSPAKAGDPVSQRPLGWNREAAAYWIPRLRGV